MPIKPENKSRYPANWKEIRAAILERAGHKCEQCNAANCTRICRGVDADVDTYMTAEAEVFDADTGEYLGRARMSEWRVGKMVRIVLTIAHLDHAPENCDPANLLALCQRCHLRYDAAHHAVNARETRKSRKAIGDLFDVTTPL
jgi:5-methylcytosine-specific restriction endonuclease McrA